MFVLGRAVVTLLRRRRAMGARKLAHGAPMVAPEEGPGQVDVPPSQLMNSRERVLINNHCMESLYAIETATLRLLALGQQRLRFVNSRRVSENGHG